MARDVFAETGRGLDRLIGMQSLAGECFQWSPAPVLSVNRGPEEIKALLRKRFENAVAVSDFQAAHVLWRDNPQLKEPHVSFVIAAVMALKITDIFRYRPEEADDDFRAEVELACELISPSQLWTQTWAMLLANGLVNGAKCLLELMRPWVSATEYAYYAPQVVALELTEGDPPRFSGHSVS